MSSISQGRFYASSGAAAPGTYNIFEPGTGREVDRFRVKAVATDGRIPFFILSDSGLGYLFRISFVNGSSWDEHTRQTFLEKLAGGLKLESQEPTVEYTFTFSCVRRPVKPTELDRYFKKDKPLTNERIAHLQAMAGKLEVQETDFYFGISASPSKLLRGTKISFVERIKALFDKKIRYGVESQLLEDVVMQFGDKVQQVISLFSGLGIRTDCPMNEKRLLSMARSAWRPNYTAPKDDIQVGVDPKTGEKVMISRSMCEDAFVSPGDFLTRDLRVETFRSHWIADGCLNMLFSLEDSPDPNIPFSAFEADRFLGFGVRAGLSLKPYFGTYTVAWSSLTRRDGDAKFRLKGALAQGMVSNRQGLFRDKMAEKEARDINQQHDDFIEGEGEMICASVMYQLQIPLEHLSEFFKVSSVDEKETIRSIARTVQTQLNEIGSASWRLEDRTYYPAWINSFPGALRSVQSVNYVPRIYLTLLSGLHLVPFYSTIGPDQDEFSGANYFLTEDNNKFVFDHFSKNNGTAANFSVCGATGSGKSVTVQSLVMMTEKINPYIMILDFGGGNVGSWTKLCACWGGVELKFGSANPPRINPFQLVEADSLPNKRKRREIALTIGIDPDDTERMREIDAAYLYLRADDTPFTKPDVRFREILDRCKDFEGIGYERTMEILRLTPGKCRPGEKGTASIRIVLDLLLANTVTEDGPVDNASAMFMPDDLNEAILRLYDTFTPPAQFPERWPTLSDFKKTLELIQEERVNTGKTHIFSFHTLMTRLTNSCVGGLDDFLDGQTNVSIMRQAVVDGMRREVPARFVLADMAGIADKKRLAIYMVTINDFMSSILYNSKDGRGIMIRDEAWLFMKSRIAAPYLEADYRLARKYGFSVITIAQNYSDFKSPVLQNNTQTWIVCSLASIDEVNAADNRFRFNPNEREKFVTREMGTKIVRDVMKGTVMDAFSRIMIANQSGKYIVKNKIGPVERWITTTDDNETFVFNYYKDSKFRGRPVMELIKWLCTREYQKDEALRGAVDAAGRKVPSI